MLVVCAWCKKVIKEGDDSQGVSHGICDTCALNAFEEHIRKLKESDMARTGGLSRDCLLRCPGGRDCLL